jgi:protein-S-isoprenylcysteine O-methyltransferase Ste14
VAINGLAVVAIRLAYLVRARRPGRWISTVREPGLLLLQAAGLTAGSLALAVFVLRPSWLAASFVGFPGWLRYVGAFLGAFAAVLLGMSHNALGESFSPLLAVRRDQRVIRTGPYRLVRHPMYTAFILQSVAFFLLTASWAVAAAWSPMVVALFLRMGREERMMLRACGEEYRAYQDRTGRLLPRLPGRKSRPARLP